MLTVVPRPPAPNSTVRYPDIVATDAIEVAHAAIDSCVSSMKKPSKELVALRDMLWAAMLHSGTLGGTAATKQAFYNHVAHIACHTNLEWHCTMTRGLFNALQDKADNGLLKAKLMLESFQEACRRSPGMKVTE